MFKCSTPSQYFQVKPASFFHLLRVIPAEAAPERPKSNFCGGKPAGGASPSPTAQSAVKRRCLRFADSGVHT